MNNQNSSKQVLLSIIGIAILVVAVVGVSFAFFNYSKAGSEESVVTTGNVFFNFTEGQAITLKNQFPMEDSQVENLTKTNNGMLEFSVVGFDTSSKGIDYTVYAVKGDKPSDIQEQEGAYTTFADTDIKLLLTSTSTDMDNSKISNEYSQPKTIAVGLTDGLALASGGKLKLATGHIAGNGSASSKQKDDYTLKMWISSDVQIYGDDSAKPSSKNEAGVYKEDDFGKMYYSLKLYIEANTTKAS